MSNLVKGSVEQRLEQKHASRGLKFTVGFEGAVPVQAYGHIDGLRFYFRFRNNHGSLIVGPYNREIEELYAQRVNEDNIARQPFMFGDIEWVFDAEKPQDEKAKDFHPHVIVKYASVPGANPEDIYNGSLSDEEAYDMFNTMMNNLVDVPEEQQLKEHMRIWLYEGRDALDEYLQTK